MRYLALMLLCCSVAFCQTAPSDYREATLVGFRTITAGSSCSSSGTVAANANDSGSVNGTTQAETYCSDNLVRLYTVQVDNNVFVLRRTISKKQTAMVLGTMGYGGFFLLHKDVLANQLPGAPILIRSQGSGFQIKVGKKESLYSIQGAQ
jgi:hypothetical protein